MMSKLQEITFFLADDIQQNSSSPNELDIQERDSEDNGSDQRSKLTSTSQVSEDITLEDNSNRQ
jgi:hypothetical protein